jgi:hypothetical protein
MSLRPAAAAPAAVPAVALQLLMSWLSTYAQHAPAGCDRAGDGVCNERLFASFSGDEGAADDEGGCPPLTDSADCVLDPTLGGSQLVAASGTAVQCGSPHEEHFVRCCSPIQLPGYVQSTDPTCGDLWYSSQSSCADTSVPCQHRADGVCDEPGGFFSSSVSCWLGSDSQDCCEDLAPRWQRSDPSGNPIDPTRVCCESTPSNCAFDCADDDATILAATAGQGPTGSGYTCAEIFVLGACPQLTANSNGTGVCGCSCPQSCPYEEDGVCDEPGGVFQTCLPGTDTADCCLNGQPRDRPEDPRGNPIAAADVCCDGTCARCASTGDGVCDEGQSCPPGSDTEDCCLDDQPRLSDASGPIDHNNVCCSTSPECIEERPRQKAEDICGADSARLCTVAEMQCTAQVGTETPPQQCQHTLDGSEMFWTSDSCDFCNSYGRVGCSLVEGDRSQNGQCNPECNSPECGWDGGDCNPGTVQVSDDTHVFAVAQTQTVCTSVSDQLGVRCCSDVPLERYEQLQGCSVWSASSFAVVGDAIVGSVLVAAATGQQAADICHAEGARRCTAQEFLDKCVTGRTTELVWTSTECVFHSTECASIGCPSNWFGDTICDAACDNALCSFDGGDCENALAPKSGVCVPTCQASALASEAMCEAESGCSWTARCVVQYHTCFSKTPRDCAASPGCHYRYGSCIESNPGQCDAWTDETSCSGQFDSAGCTWVSECLAARLEEDCSSMDAAVACAQLPGCTWDPAVNNLCAGLTRCPDETRQDRVFDSDDDSTLLDCACKPGYYDSSRLQIHCWYDDRKNFPEDDILNKDPVHDIMTKNANDGEGFWKSSCIRCPSCIDCSAGGNLTSLRINRGFGLIAESFLVPEETTSSNDASTTILDVFRCPLEDSCLNLTLEKIAAGDPRACAAGYDSAPTTPLCASCASGYMIQGGRCIECTAGSSVAAFVLMFLIMTAVALWRTMQNYRKQTVLVRQMISMLRLTWPRFVQSGRMIVTNFQILGTLPMRLGSLFPDGITAFLNYTASIIDFDLLDFPGMTCWIGDSFLTRFVSSMLTPMVVVLCTYLLKLLHLHRLRTTIMPLPAVLSVDIDTIGPPGSPQRSRFLRRRVSFKCCRAVFASEISKSYSSFIFFIIYLRYPGCSRAILDMLSCRSVDDNVSLLWVDQREICFEGNHALLAPVAWFFLTFYTLGIPGFLFYKLTSFKLAIVGKPASPDFQAATGMPGDPDFKPQVGVAAVAGNPDYIELAQYKALFQFFTPSCYRFEIYFWIEKVLLGGAIHAFATSVLDDSTGIAQFMLHAACAITFTILIAMRMPSKEPRYNWGNLVMHVFILCFYFIGHLLSPRVVTENSAFEDMWRIDVTMVGSQLFLCVYLLGVSFEKLQQLWNQAKVQVAAEHRAKEVAAASSRRLDTLDVEASDHAESLGAHFPTDLSVLLARTHYSERWTATTDTSATEEEGPVDFVNPLNTLG